MSNAYFMMGGPASGKSSAIAQLFPNVRVVDCDKFKVQHPDYDPKNPSGVHEWSQVQCGRALALVMSSGEDFVYDSTGTNAEKMVQMIQRAQELGYRTTVVYVQCSLKVALQRNAKRERTVEESIVRTKYSLIATSFDIVSRYADEVKVFNNDREKSEQELEAENWPGEWIG